MYVGDSGSVRTVVGSGSIFNEVVKRRLKMIEATLTLKEQEYAVESNRYHNFDVAARINDETPEQALWGMYTKHLVSVQDIVRLSATNPGVVTQKLLDQKLGDTHCYTLLLEGLWVRRFFNAL